MSPPIALAVRQERPLQVDAQYLPGRLRIRFARRRDGAHAVQHLTRLCRDQGRTEAGRAQRPLGADDRHDVLDSQLRAGERVPPPAVQLDVPKRRADPIVIRAPLRGAIARADRRDEIPFRISIQLDVLKSRATITIACSPGLGGPTARTCATRWPRSSPAGLTHGSSPSAAARRPRNRGRADGPWSASIEIRDGTERPGTRGGCAARRSRQ